MRLRTRSLQPELMDSPDFGAADTALCLRDLAQVNRITFTHSPTLRWLDALTRQWPRGTTLAVLDVASGQGDLLRAIHAWALRKGVAVRLSGIDLSEDCAAAARRATPADMGISYLVGNVFDHQPAQRIDAVVSSQFTHHLTDPDVVRFIQWMEQHAARGWFIADLHRHALAYYGFRWLARAFGWHRVVRLDGTTSIARSFRPAEWRNLLRAAGVAEQRDGKDAYGAQIRRRFPLRLCVGRVKPPGEVHAGDGTAGDNVVDSAAKRETAADRDATA